MNDYRYFPLKHPKGDGWRYVAWKEQDHIHIGECSISNMRKEMRVPNLLSIKLDKPGKDPATKEEYPRESFLPWFTSPEAYKALNDITVLQLCTLKVFLFDRLPPVFVEKQLA